MGRSTVSAIATTAYEWRDKVWELLEVSSSGRRPRASEKRREGTATETDRFTTPFRYSMIRGLADNTPRPEPYPGLQKKQDRKCEVDSQIIDHSVVTVAGQLADRASIPRRTPRVSVVVVLSDTHFVSPDVLVNGLRARGAQDVDVLVACAGQPANLSALQRCVGDAQFLLAPAGTSPEDLRELAMSKASGDIVTLLSGALLHADLAEQQHLKTS